MAGSDRSPESRRPRQRVVPNIDRGYSRASRAVGEQGRISAQRVEQRSNAPTPRQGARRAAAAPRQAPRSRQGVGGSGSSAKRGSSNSPRSRRAAPAPNASSSNEPRDSQVVQWIQDKWSSLAPHEQKRVYSSFFLVLSLFIFASLTVFHTAPVWQGIGSFFLTFFGWSAYLLSAGLIVFFAIRIYETVRQKRIIRLSTVFGLIILILLILLESRLIAGSFIGILAEVLAMPLLGWPPAVQHVLVIGLILVTAIFTFRITFAHVLKVAQFIERMIGDEERKALADKGEKSEVAPFLGLRPQFSRYSAKRNAEIDNEDIMLDDDDEPGISLSGRRPVVRRGEKPGVPARASKYQKPIEEEELVFDDTFESYEDYNDKTIAIPPEPDVDDYVAYEDEYQFDGGLVDDDPDNDINIHKHHISMVPRGGIREPKALDLTEHLGATQGAQQQPLSFEETRIDDEPIMVQQKPDMESLSPTPLILDSAPERPMRSGRQPRAAVNNNVNNHNTPSSRFSAANVAVKPPISSVSDAAAYPGMNANPRASAAGHKVTPNIKSATWKLPMMDILNKPDSAKLQMMEEDTEALAALIQDTLRSFRVEAEVRQEDISIGPTIVRFGIRPTGKPQMVLDEKSNRMVPVHDASGQIVYETRTRVSRIMTLQNDLALVLEAKTIRMEAPVPGRPYVGVEIPNKHSRLVTLREVLESKEYQGAMKKSKLAIGLGRDVAGLVRVGDLAKMPHLLIAGATGAGKSVMINAIIASILMQATPDDVRLLMVDPKMVELSMYNGIPHLLSPVVTEVDKVVALLKNAIAEMERRYRLFSQLGVRNLDGYRKLRQEKSKQGDISLNNLPAIVIIIDELADLMMAAPEEVEGMICRLAQLARATGIHLVVATQRPSVDVITGLIKANIPTRISFMVSSAVDSRTIIDMGGAERLLGRGDMLYLPADAGRPERIQGAFVGDEEAQALAEYWRNQIVQRALAMGESVAEGQARPQVEPGWELKVEQGDDYGLEDDLLDKAEEVVREYGRASISLLQRRLKIGYSRAARLIDLLEEHGVIGQSESGGRGREVYNHNGDGGHSMADEADEILAEERARDEFMRSQQARFQMPHGSSSSSRTPIDDDEDD